MRTPRLVVSTAAALALLPVAGAQAKLKVSILGWTTQGGGATRQVKDGETIKQCLDTGNGQRSLYVIYRGKGITKGTKVGVGVWGGSPRTGFAEEPSTADVVKKAFRWPVGPSKSSTQPSGFSFAMGPFGPIDINGAWQAKVIVKGKVVARGKVTVAC